MRLIATFGKESPPAERKISGYGQVKLLERMNVVTIVKDYVLKVPLEQ